MFKGRGTPIVGCDILFKLDGPWGQLDGGQHVNNVSSDEASDIRNIMEDFKDVFKDEIGTYNKGVFTLHLK